MSEPQEIRASDAERDHAVDVLRDAAGEGRLTLEELTDRVGRALNAKTRGELEELATELPVGALPAPAQASKPARTARWIVSVLGSSERTGRWRAPEQVNVVDVLGSTALDLRGAIVGGQATEIRVWSMLGSCEIVLPEGVDVELSGLALLGSNSVDDSAAPAPAPGAPVIRIKAYSLLGSAEVKVRAQRSPA